MLFVFQIPDKKCLPERSLDLKWVRLCCRPLLSLRTDPSSIAGNLRPEQQQQHLKTLK